MGTCEMYAVRLVGGRDDAIRRYLLLCGNCGYTTNDTACAYCPGCGARVTGVCDDGDECDALRWAHDSGFDEGYEAAREEAGL